MKFKETDQWTRAGKDAARSILLEPSPYEIDGGQLIGRDPRRVSVEEFNRAGIDGAAAMEIIRAKCLDCCANQQDEVRKCVAVTCPNWPYRMGANPFHKREYTPEQRAAMAVRLKANVHATALSPDNVSSQNSTDMPDRVQ